MMSDSCEIIVKGHLDIDWSGWFEGLTITHNTEAPRADVLIITDAVFGAPEAGYRN